MALPSIIQRLYSFTGFQQAQGNSAFPGTQTDADFDQTNNALNDLIRTIRAVIRPDGKLANGSVTRGALAADVVIGLGASRPWVSSIAYARDETVTRGYGLYVALAPNTGVIPGTNAAIWQLQADLSQAVVIAPGSIGSDSFGDRAVTEPKLADGSVSSRALARGAVDRNSAATNLGVTPVGGEIDFAGITPPPGWQFCAGQSLSRVGYVDLFNALTVSFVGNVTVGSSIVVGNPAYTAGAGLFGAQVEGPGIAPGTFARFVSDNGQMELTKPAVGTASNVTIRLFPWGFDSASTFRIPDRRDRLTAGRGDMAGSAANRITGLTNASPFKSGQLGTYGGADKVTLVNANLPVNMPGGRVSVTYPAPAVPDVTYGVFTAIQSGSGALFANIWQGQVDTSRTGNTPDGRNFTVTSTNDGGGQGFSTLPPLGFANKIIFTGV